MLGRAGDSYYISNLFKHYQKVPFDIYKFVKLYRDARMDGDPVETFRIQCTSKSRESTWNVWEMESDVMTIICNGSQERCSRTLLLLPTN